MKNNSLKLIALNVALLAMTSFPALAVDLTNPLGAGPNATDPRFILGKIIKTGLGIIGSVALIIFIYGGWKIMSSLGRSEKISSGRDTMIYAAIGLIIIFASYAIANYVITGISTAGQ